VEDEDSWVNNWIAHDSAPAPATLKSSYPQLPREREVMGGS